MPAPAPAPPPPVPPADRRRRRHQQTVEEILDAAVAIMAEEGAGGLSLGEVARRIGVRTPSLYVYFDSKNALYDAVFQRGWTLALEVVRPRAQRIADAADPAGEMLAGASDFVRWALTNPAYAQLMFWRPVPGFRPSEQAYAPAVESYGATARALDVLRAAGVLRADVDPAVVVHAWTSLVSGVISQQLSNAPGESFAEGRFTRLLPQLVAMFFAYYGPDGGESERSDDGRSGATRTRPRASGDGSPPRGRAGRSSARGDARAAGRARRR